MVGCRKVGKEIYLRKGELRVEVLNWLDFFAL
jgi:hypothetical protein